MSCEPLHDLGSAAAWGGREASCSEEEDTEEEEEEEEEGGGGSRRIKEAEVGAHRAVDSGPEAAGAVGGGCGRGRRTVAGGGRLH